MTMGRIEAVIPEDLDKKLRMAVVQRFGGKKGDLLKALTEAIEFWVTSDEARKHAKMLAASVRSSNDPMGVKQEAVLALIRAGSVGQEHLVRIALDKTVPETIRTQALKAVELSGRR